jgi:SAM-dependent methyltransferase
MSAEPFLGYGKLAAEAYRQRALGRLVALLPPGRGRRVLDLGCGEGYEAAHLAGLGWKVDAIDLEPRATWPGLAAQHKGRLRFRQGDAESLVGLKGGYDLVLQKDMLHHASHPAKALAEMARLCRPGGRVLVMEANRLNPIFYLRLTLLEGHQHFTRWRLRALLRQAGMGEASMQILEARVWPVNREPWQRFFSRMQDLLERIPLYQHIVCYHLAVWDKPSRNS